MDYDQTAMPAAYDAGRGYSPEVLEFWLNKISSATPRESVRDILDLGCGTGRYSTPLAGRFGARVVAVDPSEKMLAEARKKTSDAVRYLRGSGEALPLDEASVDMVFISMAFHHFNDPQRVALECRRVLREEGVVCLRGGVTDRIAAYPYVRFFPGAPSMIANTLTSLEFVETTFVAAGFQRHRHEVVESEVAPGWPAYAEKIAYRADSILAQLSDDEFADGLAALRRHASTAPREPVLEPVDFFVFRRA